jgi:taurine--2-oxoglutarate transaminase
LRESLQALEAKGISLLDDISGVMLETFQGWGAIFYPKDFIKELRSICDKNEILLCFDEMQSGFGRTGKWFGFINHDIIPDMICMAKGLTCGYLPFGCLMVSDKIASKYDDVVLALGLTYSAHPVACAAALETLKIYEDDKLIENTRAMETYLNSRIEDLKKIHPSIGDWRNTGLLGCLELVKNRNTKEPMAPFNAKPDEMVVMNKVAAKIKELGMYTFVRWGYVFIAPPLCITKDQIDEGLAIISEALKIADEAVI